MQKHTSAPSGWVNSTGRLRQSIHSKALVAAIKECQPLVDHWNSGALIAKGRRGDPLSLPNVIPPPSASWELYVADFSHSIIDDPIGEGKKIYDLRFFVPEPLPAPAKMADDEQMPTICLVVAEAKRMKTAGKIDDGTRITEFARMLEGRMKEAYKTNKSTPPVGWRHIKNKLPEWGLWPIKSIR